MGDQGGDPKKTKEKTEDGPGRSGARKGKAGNDGRRLVESGGGLLWRRRHGRAEIAIVHRPKYDDWSLPKGKLEDADEDLRACAEREIREETGFEARAGAFIGETTYGVTTKKGRAADKIVKYWLMEPVGGGFTPNREVDLLRWVTPSLAALLLTYAHDRELVRRARSMLEGIADGTASTRDVDEADDILVGHDAEPDEVGPGQALGPELTHLALAVRDLDASVGFYESYCGLHAIHTRGSDADGDTRIAWLADPQRLETGVVLVLAEGLASDGPLGPFAHLGFAVASRSAINELAERARSEDIVVLEPTDAGPIVGYITEVTDPDGNVCEFSYGQSLGRHARDGG